MAREASVKQLVLTHLSSRHDVDPSRLLLQAREEFSGPLSVASDGMMLELPIPD